MSTLLPDPTTADPAPAAGTSTEVLVVGAGLTGLTAARILQRHGREVLLLDKGRSPGGRLATRRLDGARFDHGLSTLAPGTAASRSLVAQLERDGLVDRWPPYASAPTWAAPLGMSAIGKHWAADGLDVRLSRHVASVERSGDVARVALDDGTAIDAAHVLLTCPLPQTLALAPALREHLPDDCHDDERYERALVVLLALDDGYAAPAATASLSGDTVSRVVSESSKLDATTSALSLRLHPPASERLWDAAPDEVLAAVRKDLAGSPWLPAGGQVRASQVKRWRYATPSHPVPASFVALPGDGPTVMAGGDGFGLGRPSGVDAAVSSAVAAAAHLMAHPARSATRA